MNLRPYQAACKRAVFGAVEGGTRRMLFVLPTGTGKTVTFASIIEDLAGQGIGPAMILAHRAELLEQAQTKLAAVAPHLRCEIEQGDRRADAGPTLDDDRLLAVVCGSVQSLVNPARLAEFRPRVIIVDEAHHASRDGKTYAKVLERFGAFEPDGPLVIGCTATPKRLDRKALHTEHGAIFEKQVFQYGIIDAIRDGWLCPLRGYRAQTDANLDAVKMSRGDFAADSVAEAMDRDAVTEQVIDRWLEVAYNRPTVIFCANVEHSHHVAWAFEAAGIAAAAVDGGMAPDQRERIRCRFEAGDLQVITNCELWTEGVDIPCISSVVLLRPTTSWALYCQMVGRGTRILDGKADCAVIDVVGNSTKHNLITLPAMLDLPYDLDMEGGTLAEAHAAIKELGERAAAIDVKHPKSMTALRLMLEEVDILAGITTPPEIQAISRLNWKKLPSGYLITAPGNRYAMLTQDTLETWLFTIHDPQWREDSVWRATGTEELVQMVDFADKAVMEAFGDAAVLMNREAGWRKGKVTDKQRGILERMKVSPLIIASLKNAGAASDLIDSRMKRRATSHGGAVKASA